MKKTGLFIIIFLTGAAFIPLLSISPDQTIAEHSLADNHYFLEFLNTSVSNFGNEENTKKLQEAAQANFNAHLWYLQNNFVKAFTEIRRSQQIMKDLYLELLQKKYLEDARALLDISAPIIVSAKDKKAELFLKLGYRDLEASRQFREVGYNYNKFLFSNKIRFFIDAIKRARRAKRFAFLALIESKTPLEEKDQYKTQTIDEHLNPGQNKDEEYVRDYEKVKYKLTNMLNRKLFENTYNFFLHHDDDYSLINKDKINLLNNIMKNVKTNEVSPDSITNQPADTQKKPDTQKTDPDPKNPATDTGANK